MFLGKQYVYIFNLLMLTCYLLHTSPCSQYCISIYLFYDALDHLLRLLLLLFQFNFWGIKIAQDSGKPEFGFRQPGTEVWDGLFKIHLVNINRYWIMISCPRFLAPGETMGVRQLESRASTLSETLGYFLVIGTFYLSFLGSCVLAELFSFPQKLSF